MFLIFIFFWYGSKPYCFGTGAATAQYWCKSATCLARRSLEHSYMEEPTRDKGLARDLDSVLHPSIKLNTVIPRERFASFLSLWYVTAPTVVELDRWNCHTYKKSISWCDINENVISTQIEWRTLSTITTSSQPATRSTKRVLTSSYRFHQEEGQCELRHIRTNQYKRKFLHIRRCHKGLQSK